MGDLRVVSGCECKVGCEVEKSRWDAKVEKGIWGWRPVGKRSDAIGLKKRCGLGRRRKICGREGGRARWQDQTANG